MSSKRVTNQNEKRAKGPIDEQAQEILNNLGGQRGPVNPHLLNELQSEVSNEATPLLQFILKHAMLIMIGLGVFVCILAGVGGYNWYSENNLLKAQGQLGSIILSNEGEKRVVALEAFLPTAPESMKSGVLLSLAETSMAIKAYDKAATYFGNLATLDPEGATGLLATLNQGQALLLAKKPKESLAVLEPIVSKVADEQRIVIQQSVAEAAIQVGDIEKARQTFENMANTSQGPEARFFKYRARTVGQNALNEAAPNDAKQKNTE